MLLGADFYEADDDAPARGASPRLGIGRDVVLDRVIVDKNARIGDGAHLVNEAGVQEADGDGYFIRDGVIIVPKDGVIEPGTRSRRVSELDLPSCAHAITGRHRPAIALSIPVTPTRG